MYFSLRLNSLSLSLLLHNYIAKGNISVWIRDAELVHVSECFQMMFFWFHWYVNHPINWCLGYQHSCAIVFPSNTHFFFFPIIISLEWHQRMCEPSVFFLLYVSAEIPTFVLWLSPRGVGARGGVIATYGKPTKQFSFWFWGRWTLSFLVYFSFSSLSYHNCYLGGSVQNFYVAMPTW